MSEVKKLKQDNKNLEIKIQTQGHNMHVFTKEQIKLEEEIEKLKQALEVLMESNEFYCDVESWNLIHPNHDRKDAKTIVNKDLILDTTANRFFGGKRAREAKKKVQEILGETK